MNINLNNPKEVREAGIQVLKETLGPVGMARFIQQYDSGNGDYTKEKQEEADVSIDEIERALEVK